MAIENLEMAGPLPPTNIFAVDKTDYRYHYYYGDSFRQAFDQLRPEIGYLNQKIFGSPPEGRQDLTIRDLDNGKINGCVILTNPNNVRKGFLAFEIMTLEIPRGNIFPIGRERLSVIHLHTIVIDSDSRREKRGIGQIDVAVAGTEHAGINLAYALAITHKLEAISLLLEAKRLGVVLPEQKPYDRTRTPRELRVWEAFIAEKNLEGLLDKKAGLRWGLLRGYFGRKLPGNRTNNETIRKDWQLNWLDKILVNEIGVVMEDGDGVGHTVEIVPAMYDVLVPESSTDSITEAVEVPIQESPELDKGPTVA